MLENLEQVPLFTKIRKTDCPLEEGEPLMQISQAACLQHRPRLRSALAGARYSKPDRLFCTELAVE